MHFDYSEPSRDWLMRLTVVVNVLFCILFFLITSSCTAIMFIHLHCCCCCFYTGHLPFTYHFQILIDSHLICHSNISNDCTQQVKTNDEIKERNYLFLNLPNLPRTTHSRVELRKKNTVFICLFRFFFVVQSNYFYYSKKKMKYPDIEFNRCGLFFA